MILIACVDDNQGMLFNRRRQSQDRLLRDRVLAMAASSKLWMNAYSAKQFGPLEAPLSVSEEFLSQAGPGEYCFLENIDPTPYLERVEGVILYHWNRKYPADFYFTLDLSAFQLVSRTDFPGSSHETITEEVYERCET